MSKKSLLSSIKDEEKSQKRILNAKHIVNIFTHNNEQSNRKFDAQYRIKFILLSPRPRPIDIEIICKYFDLFIFSRVTCMHMQLIWKAISNEHIKSIVEKGNDSMQLNAVNSSRLIFGADDDDAMDGVLLSLFVVLKEIRRPIGAFTVFICFNLF